MEEALEFFFSDEAVGERSEAGGNPQRVLTTREHVETALQIAYLEGMKAFMLWQNASTCPLNFRIGDVRFILRVGSVIFGSKGRGYAHSARIYGPATREQLKKCVGGYVCGRKILAIESYAVEDQTDKLVSLLFEDRMW